MKKPYVIWLPCWYPNRLQPFSGDFIQRHANSVGRYLCVQVIHVVRDNNLPSFGAEINHAIGSVNETTFYFNSLNRLPIIAKLFSFLIYQIQLFKAVRKCILKEGKPSAIHVHVAGRNALSGLFLSRWYKIPLHYTEHASYFLIEAKSSLYNKSFQKILWRFFTGYCTTVSAVSRHLAHNMEVLGCKKMVQVIPNTVNEAIFFKNRNRRIPVQPYRLLHISNMGYEKNLEGSLKALQKLHKDGINWTLEIFGPIENLPENLIDSMPEIRNSILISGEQPQKKIAEAMRNADLLIAFSRLETFGCVVAEALFTGLPVIVSDYPSLLELVVDGKNGIVAKNGNTDDLAECLKRFFNESDSNHFNVSVIPEKVFLPEKIGEKICKLYEIKI